jgi:hypothetical protein
MDIQKAFAQSCIFNNEIGGLPLPEIIRLEQQKRDMVGGDRMNVGDRFERLQHLIVPAGLVMQNFPNEQCYLPKNMADLPVIGEDVFDKLICQVSKRQPARKLSRKNPIPIKQRNTKKITIHD